MRFLKSAILLFPLLSMLTVACDNIDSDERYIEVGEITPKRAVLLEEFTGQNCRNCPEGHEVISKLKEQYPDAFIAVSIHAGPTDNAIPASESTSKTDQGLKQDEGDEYANAWGILSYPRGVFNRTSGVLALDKWAAQMLVELQKDADVEIQLSAKYNAATNSVEVTTTLEPTENIGGNLQLWLVESNIVSFQQNGSKRDRNYVHNHVFRSSINGTNGEAVNLTKNIFGTYSGEIKVQELWEPANLSVVAFVYNNSGVLNAAEASVSMETTEE
jgi:hypothetical protein